MKANENNRIDISKIYTLIMHKALQNALKNNFRIDYNPAGGFIKHIHNDREGVIFSFNSWIGSVACMSVESFMIYNYNKTLEDLQRIYQESTTDCTYRLKGEFYQDRYSVKIK